MAASFFPSYKRRLADPNYDANGGIDLNTDDIRIVLLTSGYVLNTAHDFLDDLVIGTNSPSSGGTSALTSPTVSTAGVFDAADTVFTAVTAGFAITQYVVYKHTGTATTSPLIAQPAVTAVNTVSAASNTPAVETVGDVSAEVPPR